MDISFLDAVYLASVNFLFTSIFFAIIIIVPLEIFYRKLKNSNTALQPRGGEESQVEPKNE